VLAQKYVTQQVVNSHDGLAKTTMADRNIEAPGLVMEIVL
tara:strand:- start:997 stop:1116 length:120 start_codon:yes stop_codon:yes gene_type:complete